MKNSFTLLEVLLSLVVFSGVLVLLLNVMGTTTRGFAGINSLQDPYLREVEELRFFVSSALNAMKHTVVSGNEINGSYVLPEGNSSASLEISSGGKSLSFSIDGSTIGSISLRNVKVLEMEKSDGHFVLMRVSTPRRTYALLFGGE